MKYTKKLIMLLLIVILVMMVACSNTSTKEEVKNSELAKPVETTDTNQNNDNKGNTSIEKVQLSNKYNVGGNYNYNFDYYDFNISYNGEYIIMIDWQSMFLHGKDINMQPVLLEGFNQHAQYLHFYNGKLYYLVDESGTGEYYLYSWDFKNNPVKLLEDPLTSYLILNNEIIYRTEYLSSPLYVLDLSNNSISQLSESCARNFTTDGTDIYYISDDFGNADGLIKHDMNTQEDVIVVFPFYSNNFIVHDNYLYYEYENSINYMDISREDFNDLSFIKIQDIEQDTASLNISDDRLYFQTEFAIKSCELNGTDIQFIYTSETSLNNGTFIIGDRIYFRDDLNIYMIKKDGSDFVKLNFPQ